MVHCRHQAWDRRSTDAFNLRYLELADIALKLGVETASVESATDKKREIPNLSREMLHLLVLRYKSFHRML